MKQTEQYGLNQWELADRIRMDDFNADNAKIDAALAGKLDRIETIYYSTSKLPTDYMSIATIVNLWGAWEDWEVFGHSLYFDTAPFDPNDAMTVDLDGKMPDGTEKRLSYEGLRPASLKLLLFPRHDRTRLVSGLLLCGGAAHVIHTPFSFHNFTNFNMTITPKGRHKISEHIHEVTGIR